jgi:HD superfamily phosphodiesterase
MEETYRRIFERARPYIETRDNVIHTTVAYSFAVKLLAAEGGDEAVVLPAVILHDVGWKCVPEDLQLKAFGPGRRDTEIRRIHEVEGTKIARAVLEEIGYDPRLIDEICEIIVGHDSRTEALSLNDAIVKDSDKLWRFSEPALKVDPDRFGIHPAVHAEWLKHQIDGWFLTKTARKLAIEEQRQRALTYGPPPPECGGG